mmetsp:Transcript_8449/g.35806  ORF Transcript_8449/g.35806 Transcript_8449/m.35806 type:complete len:233 (+) Transcript_8449:1885-2583(+)
MLKVPQTRCSAFFVCWHPFRSCSSCSKTWRQRTTSLLSWIHMRRPRRTWSPLRRRLMMRFYLSLNPKFSIGTHQSCWSVMACLSGLRRRRWDTVARDTPQHRKLSYRNSRCFRWIKRGKRRLFSPSSSDLIETLRRSDPHTRCGKGFLSFAALRFLFSDWTVSARRRRGERPSEAVPETWEKWIIRRRLVRIGLKSDGLGSKSRKQTQRDSTRATGFTGQSRTWSFPLSRDS